MLPSDGEIESALLVLIAATERTTRTLPQLRANIHRCQHGDCSEYEDGRGCTRGACWCWWATTIARGWCERQGEDG